MTIARAAAGSASALGLGAVLNTTFNIHGEPLVCTPDEAVAVFREAARMRWRSGLYLGRQRAR